MPSPIILSDQSGLAQGITGAGSVLAQALGNKISQQRQQELNQKYGSILQNTLADLPDNPTSIQISSALSKAMSQGVPPELISQYGNLYTSLKRSEPNQQATPQQVDKMANLFQKFGMDKDEAERNAELWGNLTTGGQTEMAKFLVDQISRGSVAKSGKINGVIPEEYFVEEKEVEEFKFPKINIFEDRTPKEKTTLKTELLKSGNIELKEISESLKKNDNEVMRYEQLERLNESGKLPEGLGRLNINWTTGDIKIPALANPETQQFVKTINDFTVAAKETYGSRVTNFELGAFMKRLPTLANTTEGRRLILAQMKAMKALDKLYDESLQKVYDQYGVQNIDRQNVIKIAKELRKDDEQVLKKQFADSVKAQEIYDLRKKAPEGMLPVRKPDGTLGYLPIDKIDQAKKLKWEIL